MDAMELLDSPIEELATGFAFTEGPLWHPDGFWIFSDIPNNRINKVTPQGDVEVFREPSGNSNGLTFDRQGRLLACEHGNRRVSRTSADGTVETLVDRFAGKRLNSPNDVVVHSCGAVYFTDPPYGIKPNQQEQAHNGVYRVDGEGQMLLLADDFERPNGLAFSPDESILYIDDSHHQHIRAFDVADDGSLHNGRLFADLSDPGDGVPDGMKIDRDGRVFATNARGLWVFDGDGSPLGVIETPQVPANCAWGEDGRTLLMTARTSVYTVRVKTAGIAAL